MIYVGDEQRDVTIEDVEPVGRFLAKIGEGAYGRYTVDVAKAGRLLEGRIVIGRAELDCFAAELAALGGERPELAYLYDHFVAAFSCADARTLTGAAD